MADATIIDRYSPNTEWGKQHVEIVLKQWEYEARFTVRLGGNCLGFIVLEHAVGRLYEDLTNELPDDQPASVTLTAPDGRKLLCEDDEQDEESWLKAMCVSLRIVAYDPPTLNQVRAIHGAAPVADGNRPYDPS